MLVSVLLLMFEVIFHTRNTVSDHISKQKRLKKCMNWNFQRGGEVFPNNEKRVENTTHSGVFLTNFEVFGKVVKHGLECLIYLLNRN